MPGTNPYADDDGPCVWPVDMSCCPGWPQDEADWSPEHHLSLATATETLWRLTAGRYGLCPELIRPCRRSCTPDGYGTGFLWGDSPLRPYQDSRGRWFNFGCGCGPSDCSCKPMCALDLPGPVDSVLEVRIDGAVLPDTEYRLLRRGAKAELIRVDRGGGECWPTCQDLTLAETEPGTFSVLYLRGRSVPAAGQRALGALACEIYKQCSGASGCRLPERVRTVSREGVTYDMFDPGEWLEQGLTGLREVDSWLRAVNPHQLKQPSAVFSLDLPPAPHADRTGWGS